MRNAMSGLRDVTFRIFVGLMRIPQSPGYENALRHGDEKIVCHAVYKEQSWTLVVLVYGFFIGKMAYKTAKNLAFTAF